ncbi:hypothetical protein D3C75_538080 [compost metagenome]
MHMADQGLGPFTQVLAERIPCAVGRGQQLANGILYRLDHQQLAIGGTGDALDDVVHLAEVVPGQRAGHLLHQLLVLGQQCLVKQAAVVFQQLLPDMLGDPEWLTLLRQGFSGPAGQAGGHHLDEVLHRNGGGRVIVVVADLLKRPLGIVPRIQIANLVDHRLPVFQFAVVIGLERGAGAFVVTLFQPLAGVLLFARGVAFGLRVDVHRRQIRLGRDRAVVPLLDLPGFPLRVLGTLHGRHGSVQFADAQ